MQWQARLRVGDGQERVVDNVVNENVYNDHVIHSGSQQWVAAEARVVAEAGWWPRPGWVVAEAGVVAEARVVGVTRVWWPRPEVVAEAWGCE